MADRASDVTRIVQGGRARGLSDDEIRALVKRYDERTQQPPATPPPEWALQPSLQRQSTPDDLIDPGDRRLGASAHSRWEETKRHPVQTLAMLAIPGTLGVASRYGPPAVRSGATALSSFLAKPAVGATIGAAEGYRQNGITGAAIGGLAGASGSTKVGEFLKRVGLNGPDRVAQGMSQAGAAAKPTTTTLPPALAALMRGAKYDELAAIVKPPAAPSTPAAALQREVMARQGPIDWRTTDAVPIDAMTRKGIIEPGESRVGLAERMAQAMKAQDLQEAERLARALRQRMHISEKQ